MDPVSAALPKNLQRIFFATLFYSLISTNGSIWQFLFDQLQAWKCTTQTALISNLEIKTKTGHLHKYTLNQRLI